MYKTIRNIFIIFLVSGFWHGANWTFIVWGGLNALYITPSIIMRQNRKNLDVAGMDTKLPTIHEFFNILTTLILTMLAWIVFRSEDISHAWIYISNIFDKSIIEKPEYYTAKIFFIIAFLFATEWAGRKKDFALDHFGSKINRAFRWAFYIFIVLLICVYYTRSDSAFIYFQF